MGWNGSDQAKAKVGRSVPDRRNRNTSGRRAGKGIVAGVIVMAIGCVVLYLYTCPPSSAPSTRKQAPSTIAGVTHTTHRPAPGTDVATVKREVIKPKNAEEAMAQFSSAAKPIKIGAVHKIRIPAGYTNRTFRTSTEQMIGWLCAVELGDMPLPMPNISDEDREHLAEILTSKNEVKEGDDEFVTALKGPVDNLKKEMCEYIKRGGEANDFLQYYYRELRKAAEQRQMAAGMVEDMIAEDPNQAKEFLEAVNKKLEAEGIKPVHFEDSDFEVDTEGK